jgi:hypothetical protein|tara:strand:+ start:2092 stop:3384 length:1293 start_codon:yes stop_codon:yes gene_type:complete
MPQFFRKFGRSDVYINTIKAYPEVKFTIYSGGVSYNNAPQESGSFTSSVGLIGSGALSLYELNVDRAEASGQAFAPNNVENINLIRPWVSKDGTRMAFRTTTKAGFNASSPGSIIYSSYPLSASITPNYYSATTPRSTAATFSKTSGTGIAVSGQAAMTRILALKNIINYYNYLNPNFAYSSSNAAVDASNDGTNPGRDFDNCDLGLVSIPSIFYGSSIKEGTVDLKFYFTGTLLGRAQDTARNGVLYETTGASPGSPVGIVLYNEGMLILTGAWAMDAEAQEDYKGNNTTDFPRWVYFAQPVTGPWDSTTKTSYIAEMSGTTTLQSLTMFAAAPKGELNHSNNPSFTVCSTGSHVLTASSAYLQDQKRVIKNVVSSSYNDPTGSFEKTTYISKIGIYDENENLIAIAKPATPIKKVVDRDFTFKLKLDI